MRPNKTDKFFRQALSSAPDLSPTEKDWKDMERLLKDKPGRRPVLAWLYWPAGIAAALLIFFSVWLSDEKLRTPDQQAKSKTSAKQSENAINKVISPEGSKNNTPLNPEGNEKSNTLQVQAGSVKKAESSPLDFNSIINTDNFPLQKQVVLNPGGAGQFLSINPAEYQGMNIYNKITLNSVPLIATDQLKLKNKLISDSIPSRNKASVENSNGKWAMSLAFSPDMNSVKGIGSSSLGLSLGMGLSYKITRSISAGTGLYYSQKKYTSDKTSYKVTEKPFATWTSYSKQIDADCRVLDIPLNLNIMMKSSEKTRILASAGLSSYLFLSEKYNFIFAYPAGGREYIIRNANQHILSVVNLSVGLEKPLTGQSSIVIQPYAKLPLTGIGQGETDLKSFGIGFQLNYSLKKKNKFFRSEP